MTRLASARGHLPPTPEHRAQVRRRARHPNTHTRGRAAPTLGRIQGQPQPAPGSGRGCRGPGEAGTLLATSGPTHCPGQPGWRAHPGQDSGKLVGQGAPRVSPPGEPWPWQNGTTELSGVLEPAEASQLQGAAWHQRHWCHSASALSRAVATHPRGAM